MKSILTENNNNIIWFINYILFKIVGNSHYPMNIVHFVIYQTFVLLSFAINFNPNIFPTLNI